MTYKRRMIDYTERLLHEIEAERAELRRWYEAAEHQDMRDGYGEQIRTLDAEHELLRGIRVTLHVTNAAKSLQHNGRN